MLTAEIFFDVSMTAAQHCAVDKGHYHKMRLVYWKSLSFRGGARGGLGGL